MTKRIISILLIFVILLLCSCNGNSGIETGKQTTATVSAVTDKNADISKASSTDSEFETNENDRNIIELYKIKKAAELYREAANMVKEKSAGFTKSEWQEITEIDTGDFTGIADRVLDIVAENVLTSESDAFASKAKTVAKGSRERINLLFPVYNKDFACVLEKNYDCISSAEYDKKDDFYEITLKFADVINAEENSPGFGQIMTPFIRSEVLDIVKKYVFVIDKDALKLDFLYRDCLLKCKINAKTMQIESMEQHITAYLSAAAEINLLGLKSGFLNGTATIKNHLYFYDFDWE